VAALSGDLLLTRTCNPNRLGWSWDIPWNLAEAARTLSLEPSPGKNHPTARTSYRHREGKAPPNPDTWQEKQATTDGGYH